MHKSSWLDGVKESCWSAVSADVGSKASVQAHRPRRSATRLVWLLTGGLVVTVVGLGVSIYKKAWDIAIQFLVDSHLLLTHGPRR